MSLPPTAPPHIAPETAERQAELDTDLGPALDRWMIKRGVKRELRPATKRVIVRRIDEIVETQRGE